MCPNQRGVQILQRKIRYRLIKIWLEMVVASILGVTFSIISFIGLGMVIGVFLYMLYEVPFWGNDSFWLSYSLFFIMGMFLENEYRPKEHYYTGIAGSYVDNPLTFRDDRDRIHMFLGFLLLVPSFVAANFRSLVRLLSLSIGIVPLDFITWILHSSYGSPLYFQRIDEENSISSHKVHTALQFLEEAKLICVDYKRHCCFLTVEGEEFLYS